MKGGQVIFVALVVVVLLFIWNGRLVRKQTEAESKHDLENAPKCYWCDKKAALTLGTRGKPLYCVRCGNYGCKEHLSDAGDVGGWGRPPTYHWLCDADWPRFTNGRKRPRGG